MNSSLNIGLVLGSRASQLPEILNSFREVLQPDLQFRTAFQISFQLFLPSFLAYVFLGTVVRHFFELLLELLLFLKLGPS